jgi:hypothetical protein
VIHLLRDDEVAAHCALYRFGKCIVTGVLHGFEGAGAVKGCVHERYPPIKYRLFLRREPGVAEVPRLR